MAWAMMTERSRRTTPLRWPVPTQSTPAGCSGTHTSGPAAAGNSLRTWSRARSRPRYRTQQGRRAAGGCPACSRSCRPDCPGRLGHGLAQTSGSSRQFVPGIRGGVTSDVIFHPAFSGRRSAHGSWFRGSPGAPRRAARGPVRLVCGVRPPVPGQVPAGSGAGSSRGLGIGDSWLPVCCWWSASP